ncbi:uncharacterized protein LOC113211236 [Frankliniella occidentalis]|uniref:Uncharacterized protein LOC113211236 n=1 Tax=Frankliniella occidentalis TaxID=133901 RepID=A0A9C6UBX5_FRAOC|nr:uncharacterized protein LOC113211236 [Frankliniella occidentalis]
MKVFIAVLALASVAAATTVKALSEHVHDPSLSMRVVPVYGASDINFQLSQEKYGIKGLYDMPMVLAGIFGGKMLASRLGHGLQSLYQEPKLSPVVDNALTGPETVALFLSAARTLDIPELKLTPIKKSYFTPTSTGVEAAADDFDALPWVYIVDKPSLPAGSLEKLQELGQFNVFHDKIVLEHDILAEQAAQLFKPKEEVHPSLLPSKDMIFNKNVHPSLLPQ